MIADLYDTPKDFFCKLPLFSYLLLAIAVVCLKTSKSSYLNSYIL